MTRDEFIHEMNRQLKLVRTEYGFTQEAMDYALNYPNATLSLIDGRKLANLMIKYNLGVATESVVEIKRVDSDYFEG